MSEVDRFVQNARSRGCLIDTQLFVLFVVGLVNRDRISRFKRTGSYTSDDWDLLAGLLQRFPTRYSIPHVLAEVGTLTDLKSGELSEARTVLRQAILILKELQVPSIKACASPYYARLGLTDAAIGLAARQTGCSVLTDDSELYVALLNDGASVLRFDVLKQLL